MRLGWQVLLSSSNTGVKNMTVQHHTLSVCVGFQQCGKRAKMAEMTSSVQLRSNQDLTLKVHCRVLTPLVIPSASNRKELGRSVWN
jgi:hypothetical protein